MPPNFNGGILIAQDDKILYKKYVSYKDEVDEHSAFDLASVTKTFTAMAILKLEQEQKIKLDDAITQYIPKFPFNEITIKMLLNHRSGLKDYVKFMDESTLDKSKSFSNNDVLDYIISNKNKILLEKPNEVFNYSNTNYMLLALVIEKATGMSYSTYLTQTFFNPLRMNDTYVLNSNNFANAKKSYYKSGKKYDLRFLDLIYGDKGIYSSTIDLKRWDSALVEGRFFSNSTLNAAFNSTSNSTNFTSNYSLGWKKIKSSSGKEIIYHNGWWAGNRSLLIRLINEKVVIVVLSNNNFTNISEVRKLCDLFGDYQQNNNTIRDF